MQGAARKLPHATGPLAPAKSNEGRQHLPDLSRAQLTVAAQAKPISTIRRLDSYYTINRVRAAKLQNPLPRERSGAFSLGKETRELIDGYLSRRGRWSRREFLTVSRMPRSSRTTSLGFATVESDKMEGAGSWDVLDWTKIEVSLASVIVEFPLSIIISGSWLASFHVLSATVEVRLPCASRLLAWWWGSRSGGAWNVLNQIACRLGELLNLIEFCGCHFDGNCLLYNCSDLDGVLFNFAILKSLICYMRRMEIGGRWKYFG